MANSKQTPSPNDPFSVWVEQKSQQGHPYAVKHLKAELTSAVAPVTAKQGFSIDVNWPVSNGWVTTTQEVQQVAAISAYNLWAADGLIYKWELAFININGDHYNYYFQDDTDDQYNVNTFRDGDHEVSYNSEGPRIKHISGS
jgi:hypothetical protein